MRALYFLVLCVFLTISAPAQQRRESAEPDTSSAEAPQPDPEEQALRQGVRDANGSQVDIMRALEKHLVEYPESKRREEIEYVLLKTATDLDDEARIMKYGQLFLNTGANDVTVFDRVIPLMLRDASEASATKALEYAQRYEGAAQSIHENKPDASGLLYSWKRKRDRAFARAFVFQARAQGNLGKHEEALKFARRSFDIDPSAEAAREMGRWLAALERTDEAVASYATAFTIEDSRNDAAHRQQDRQRMGELYTKAHGSEQGLGDVILASYDRSRTVLEAKRAELAALAPNVTARKASEFVLSDLEGDALPLQSLRGKVVVVDFWATWCGPCRKQHPLYEEVKERFDDNGDVVFLSVNTDEDRSVVAPFLRENQWSNTVHFEDGLAGFLRISSIPTTLILGRDGEVFSRMNGFIPETFVDQLSERVTEALGKPLPGAVASR